MPIYNFQPEKYWSINDERITILKKYLASFNIEQLVLLPTEKIVKICIDGLRTFKLSKKEKNELKELIMKQNGKILEPCIKEMCSELSEIKENEITIISLGCGAKSLFERVLDETITKKLPYLKVNWLGVDIGDFRGTNSFFKNKPFKVIEADANIKYVSLVDYRNSPIVLIGRYSFHHIGIEFEEFINRCVSIDKVMLVEEPTAEKKWNLPDYRFMRIAYDVLANSVFSRGWVSAFINEPNIFKVNYINSDKLLSEYKLLELSDVFPETALITVKAKRHL